MYQEADEEMPDKHLLDTGIACTHDGDVIEYMDLVMVILMIKPYLVQGKVTFYDITSEDDGDYIYEPVFFHGRNWDEVEEEFRQYLTDRKPVEVAGAILNCAYCGSGILPGETTGAALTGEIHRSQRNPDLEAYGNHFEPLPTAAIVICISCMHDLNTDVQEMWPDGVAHGEECDEGKYARCWRQSCPGNCANKNQEQ